MGMAIHSLMPQHLKWIFMVARGETVGMNQSRRIEMNKLYKWIPFLLLILLLAAIPAMALPGKPDFGPHVFADGQAWGTKVTTVLPVSNGKNAHSFDKFFVITNGAEGQLPVGEAAPRNPAYNGGRWVTYTASWTEEGMAAHDPLPVLKSYEDIMLHEGLGHLEVEKGSPGGEGAPPPYFQCPLLPVK
jgi:hypothetical protein